MKTPREILLEQHQAAGPKLDAIREQVVAGVAQTSKSAVSRVSQPGTSALEAGWRQFLWSLRWHLAGLSAVWLVVLGLSIAERPAPTREVRRRSVPSSRQLLTVLRENQRQLRGLIRAPAAEATPKPQQPAPSPRSQVQPFSMPVA